MEQKGDIALIGLAVMGQNLIICLGTMAVCLTIQCIVVGALLDVLVFLEKRELIRQTLIGVTFLLVALMIIMLAGNIIQITIWAGLFYSYGEFEAFTTAFYHSVVNFATLGYGDITPISPVARTLAYIEALFGQFYIAILVAGFVGLGLTRGNRSQS